MLHKDYTDKRGIQRRVLVPDEYTDPAKGILTSVYLDEELKKRGWTQESIKRLYENLWRRGLVTRDDFLMPQAAELLRAAILATVRMDVQTLQEIAALEQTQDGRTNHRT